MFLNLIHLYSQNPDLLQRWYVQSITTDGITTFVPSDPINFPFVYLQFFSTQSGLSGSSNIEIDGNCQIGFTGHVSHQSTSVFNFIDFTPFNMSSSCNNTILNFMNAYVNYFSSTISSTYSYTITDEIDSTKKLTLTNNANNVIVFSNKFYNAPPLQLVENEWYLHDLIIDGVSHSMPSNNCISDVQLTLSDNNYSFATQVVSFLYASALFDYTNSLYYSYEYVTNYSMVYCNYPPGPIDAFTDLYIGAFYHNNIPSGPFNYNITDEGSIKKLTITNPQNNQAIYNNFPLSIDETNYYNVKIYPNPTNDYINVENNSNIIIENVEVINILGQNIFTTNDNIIDLKNFENGVYNIRITLNKGVVLNKKIIKMFKKMKHYLLNMIKQ